MLSTTNVVGTANKLVLYRVHLWRRQGRRRPEEVVADAQSKWKVRAPFRGLHLSGTTSSISSRRRGRSLAARYGASAPSNWDRLSWAWLFGDSWRGRRMDRPRASAPWVSQARQTRRHADRLCALRGAHVRLLRDADRLGGGAPRRAADALPELDMPDERLLEEYAAYEAGVEAGPYVTLSRGPRLGPPRRRRRPRPRGAGGRPRAVLGVRARLAGVSRFRGGARAGSPSGSASV